MRISVIVCTHDPRRDHLARTLAGLRGQTLAVSEWELVIVDNASTRPLQLEPDWSWHPQARVVVEPELGLIPARLRGIAESRGDLRVFVDDDNVLAPDYLAVARDIAEAEPNLGAFGAEIAGEFETPPAPWFAARIDRLAIRKFDTASTTDRPDPRGAPCGAGLCVRSNVAVHYREHVLRDPRRLQLGRAGGQLFSGDDLDLAFTACDLGLRIGLRPALKLTHLIPRERLTFRYFARITQSHALGHLRLHELRPGMVTSPAELANARRAARKWGAIAAFLSLFPPAREKR